MRQAKLGVCFYPTTVGLIDDNKEYLEHLVSRLKAEKVSCLTYSDPKKALDFLTKQYQSDSFINRCLQSKESNEFDRLVTELDITAIRQEIHNPHRSSEIAVLVIDYAMPNINGLELCRQLRETPVKIIMLTGEVGKEFAVEAFNEGSIDKFIPKNTPSLLEVLAQTIRELQTDYFLDISKMALNRIADFAKQTLSCLSDPVFVNFFEQLCKEHHIVEYFLVDLHGSFLLLDSQGKLSMLAMANEELMLTYNNLAEDDEAPESVVASLKAKQRMPYFHTEEDFTVRPAEWEKYLHPVNKLEGNQIYYYAYITDPNVLKVTDKILSYQKFLEMHNKA